MKILFGLVVLGTIVYASYDSILPKLVDTLDIHSRTLNKILSGEKALTNLSGRVIFGWRPRRI